MTAPARFDLKLDPDDKDLFSLAANMMGTTMAGFVRAAAKEKAQEIIERETRIKVSQRDYLAFSEALEKGFAPNAALERALNEAREIVRCD